MPTVAIQAIWQPLHRTGRWETRFFRGQSEQRTNVYRKHNLFMRFMFVIAEAFSPQANRRPTDGDARQTLFQARKQASKRGWRLLRGKFAPLKGCFVFYSALGRSGPAGTVRYFPGFYLRVDGEQKLSLVRPYPARINALH